MYCSNPAAANLLPPFMLHIMDSVPVWSNLQEDDELLHVYYAQHVYLRGHRLESMSLNMEHGE